MPSLAAGLAAWATELLPSAADEQLARRSLVDTVAVAIAARDESIVGVARELGTGGRWAVAAHALDFDDLHMESTTHISTICVPAALATGGSARAYLAGAGVMARLGNGLGWKHYAAGWHATTTTGAPAAAVTAGIALGLDAERIATAIALAVPAAGGVQRAFGTDSKPLQVGFAVDAGIRAARLAAAGATADPAAVDQWFDLLGGDRSRIHDEPEAVPGGLAIKIYPCCYAMQRPINAVHELVAGMGPHPSIERVTLRTPEATVAPLIHHRPATAQASKFSLEYAVATAVLDEYAGFASFTDDAARRPEAVDIMDRVIIELVPGGDWLLAGELEVEIETGSGVRHTSQRYPPGSPERPPTPDELAQKVRDCVGDLFDAEKLDWTGAAHLLTESLGA